MHSYRRPEFAPVVLRDASGAVIDYGNRWGGEPPPEDSYSVTSNLERFRPLHAIASALIDTLVADYDVAVEDDVSLASDLMHPRDDIVRAVRVTPSDPAAAPLTFVFAAHPSVLMHAGLLQDFLYPVCTCDACDEDGERIADAMEWDVQSIVAGGFSESARSDAVSFRLIGDDGSRSGSERMTGSPSVRLVDAERRLAAIEGWAAWPSRVRNAHAGIREEKRGFRST